MMSRSLIKPKSHVSKGFTLVELMVVITILGLLVAIAVPNLVSIVKRAQNTDIVNNAGKFQQFLETYTIEAQDRGVRAYPTKPSEITAMSFYHTQNIKNPFYAAPGSSVGADDTEGTVKFSGSAPGQWIVYIPTTKLLFDATLASASVVAPSPQGKGMLVYYPFGGATQEFPSGATDMINGYQIKAVDADGRYILGFTLKAGEPYIY